MNDARFLARMEQRLREEQQAILKRLKAKQETGTQIIENWSEPSDLEDVAAFTQEEEIFRLLSERELRELQEIQEALRRIREGTYGICRRCKKKIERERLELLPTTDLCQHCAQGDQARMDGMG